MTDSKIILPYKDGVANLEIKRMQSELEEKSSVEKSGMPPKISAYIVESAEKLIGEIKSGGVNSACLIWTRSDDKDKLGVCVINVKKGEIVRVDKLFHASLSNFPAGWEED